MANTESDCECFETCFPECQCSCDPCVDGRCDYWRSRHDKCAICGADKPDDIPSLLHEHAPCLCGAPMPCDCFWPRREITLVIEVSARTADELPTPDSVRSLVEMDLLDNEYPTWRFVSVGYPNNDEDHAWKDLEA